MSMSEKIKEEYKRKLISPEDAVKLVKSDTDIVSGLAAAEGRLFLKNLSKVKDKVQNVSVLTCLPMQNYDYFSDSSMEGHFYHEGWFFTGSMRSSSQKINTYVPNHLHMAGTDRLAFRKPHIFCGVATPPDKNGYMSLSLSATYEVEMLENAEIVILEVNPKFPKTFGDVTIHISQATYLIEADYNPPEIPIPQSSEKDFKIAENIAQFLENGNTLQLGIGGMPNAVGMALAKHNLKDIGIHTEMLTSGMVDLFEAGVINGKKKTLLPGKMVSTFALGDQKLYDFINENPGVVINRSLWINDPYQIAQNHKQISINSDLEIDLTGQVCSESIGPVQFSGTGGQADTAIGAQKSAGGKSFICLYSTANVKDKATGEKKPVSKIVPMLQPGAKVTLHRSNVDYVVTELGVVRLKGLSVRERAKRLISIAHPDFQAQLTEEAKKLQYM